MSKLVKKILVPGGQARAFEMKKGQFLTIVDVQGYQVADFMAFKGSNYNEKLSPVHTRTSLLTLKIEIGDKLRTNLRNPIFKVVEDTVGCLDMLLAACDERRYSVDYGVENHRSCVANFEEVLKPYGILRVHLPDPFNIFQNTKVESNGKLVQQGSPSRPGDYMVFQALMDVLGAVSACPMDLNPIGGKEITDVMVKIHEK